MAVRPPRTPAPHRLFHHVPAGRPAQPTRRHIGTCGKSRHRLWQISGKPAISRLTFRRDLTRPVDVTSTARPLQRCPSSSPAKSAAVWRVQGEVSDGPTQPGDLGSTATGQAPSASSSTATPTGARRGRDWFTGVERALGTCRATACSRPSSTGPRGRRLHHGPPRPRTSAPRGPHPSYSDTAWDPAGERFAPGCRPAPLPAVAGRRHAGWLELTGGVGVLEVGRAPATTPPPGRAVAASSAW
jgi:hypothetical protein